MASVPGAISVQPAAEALQGQEALPLDQAIGNPVAATAMVVGNAYRIVTIGNTNWQTAGAPAGAVVGTLFKCEATGTGTGTAQRMDTRQAALSALASFVLGSNANISALASQVGQTAYGRAFLALLDQAAARDYIGIGPDDSLTLTGLAVTGTATLSHIHGNLAGGLYAHVRNVSGGPIAAGTPLRVTGTVGDTTTLQVVPADASSASTMPALFIASEALTATGAGTDGHATMTGEIGGLDTSGLTSGAPLYVRSGGGAFTSTRPAANAQQVATVGRVHANTGSVHVLPWPVLGTAAAAAVGDFAAAGAPAAAVGAHEGAADPHPQYLTPAEGNAAYATAAQGALAGTAVQPDTLAAGLAGKANTGAIGSSGLTMTVGVLGRESGTGAPQVLTLGGGLSIVNGALVLTAGGTGTVTSVGLSVPTGFSVTSSPITTSGTLALAFTLGYSLPTTASQGNWDAAYSERLRWDGGSAGLNAATARSSLQLGTAATSAVGDFATAAHNQLASTISDSTATGRAVLTATDAAAARSAIEAGTSSVAVSSSAPAALAATAAAGTSTDAARIDHAHQRDADVIVIPVGDESTALTTGTNKVRFRLPFAATLLSVRANVNTAPTGSTLIVDVNEAGTSMLSTKLSIDASETSSTTAATAAVISDSSLADNAEISIDIDQIGSTVAGAGLKVSLFVRRA
jgi:hypothetical protein